MISNSGQFFGTACILDGADYVDTAWCGNCRRRLYVIPKRRVAKTVLSQARGGL